MNYAEIITWLASDNGIRVHAGVFTLLILGGLGFPVPEDVPLLLAGVAVSKGIVSTYSAFAVCYVGVLLGDQMMYLFGYFFGHKLVSAGERSPFLPRITEERINAVREGLRKKRLVFIFVGRHLFPIRSVTFVTAGSLRIPFLEFFVADAFAALISVALMLGIGHVLGDRITPDTVEHVAERAHYYLGAIILLSLAVYGLSRKLSRSKTQLTVTALPAEQCEDICPKEKKVSVS